MLLPKLWLPWARVTPSSLDLIMSNTVPQSVVSRLMTEACDLRDRTDLLKAYLDKGAPGANRTQVRLMRTQYDIHVSLLGVLRERLTNFGVKELVRPTPAVVDDTALGSASLPVQETALEDEIKPE